MVKRQSTKQELAPKESVVFPFRARWISAGLTVACLFRFATRRPREKGQKSDGQICSQAKGRLYGRL